MNNDKDDSDTVNTLEFIREMTQKAIDFLEEDWHVVQAFYTVKDAARRYRAIFESEGGDIDLLKAIEKAADELEFGSPEKMEDRLEDIISRLNEMQEGNV